MVVFGSKSASAKTKLFEQPLDKLFNPKAIKQLNEAISASSPRLPLSSSLSAPLTSSSLTWAKLSRDNSVSKRRRTLARLRRFTIDTNNNANLISSITTQQTRTTTTQPHTQIFAQNTLPNHLKHDEIDSQTKQKNSLEESPVKHNDEAERARLLLNVLPEPIKRLLNELYLRGPDTVGIFRKSPNAKHCKELKQKLEAADGQQNSIEQFQVAVIASVFKEWLRSLPDCLLMSRLYPQWIDVAKLIEPLHLERQHQEQQSNRNIDSQDAQDATTATSSSPFSSSNLESTATNPSTSGAHQRSRPDRGELSRALSCSVMTATSDSPGHSSGFAHDVESLYPMASLDASKGSVGHQSRRREFKIASRQRIQSEDLDHQPVRESEVSRPSMTQLELRERQSECIRIVRQLLELLNEPNLILLRAIICVLWHIADNSEHNKMSSQNLGVCIGQSLLNDEHQSKKGHTSSSNLYSMRSTSNLSPTSPSSGASSALKHFSSSNFAKRHRRTRSQGLLASTLSLTNLSHLSSSPSSTNNINGTSSSPHNSSMNNCSLLDSSGPQEAAKYVPILVAFMIDNAKALFGYDIVNLFGKQHPSRQLQSGSSDILQQQDSCNRSPVGSSLASQPTVTSACAITTLETPHTQKKLSDIDANPASNQSVTPVARPGQTINNQARLEDEQKRPPTATQRLCLNSSDLVIRSSANLINNSTGAADAAPGTKTHRRNLSMSVIVQIGNIARDISKAAAVAEQSEELRAVPEMRASSPLLSEPGTTTSILIENNPNTRKQPTVGGDRQRVNQSSVNSFTGTSNTSDDEEVDSCRRQPSESQSVSPICGSQSGCSIDSTHQQRPLSASESTGSSSRASSSTSGVHSESPAFSSETDTHHHRSGQATNCSSSISASISSPDPSSMAPSICTSPVDMVDGLDMGSDYRLDSAKSLKRQQCNRPVSGTQLIDNRSLKSSSSESTASNTKEPPVPLDRTSRRGRLARDERPKSMASLNDDELLELRTGMAPMSLNLDDNLSSVRNEYERKQEEQQRKLIQSRDHVNCSSQQQPHRINYASQRANSLQSQTLNRYSSASSYHMTADRMPKIPFRYTTSCYGGEAVLYYPTCTHLAQQHQKQQQQQQDHRDAFQPHRVCARIHSLDRHSQPWSQQHQLPQRSHVMMLRDYYLSLQEQNQQKQQNLTSHQHRRPASMNFLQQRIQELHKDLHPTSQQPVIVSPVKHITSHNELARLQQQRQHLQGTKYAMQAGTENPLYTQQQGQKQEASNTGNFGYQRLQSRSAAQRANQYNGLYVKRFPSPSHLVADVAAISGGSGVGAVGGHAGLIVRPLGNSDGSVGAHCGGSASMMAVSQSSLSQQSSKMSSTSSTEHSADDDESDDYSTGEWMESTMV